MRFEYEVLDSDLEDWKRLLQLENDMAAHLEKLSTPGKELLMDSIDRIEQDVMFLKDEWTLYQRKRVANCLSQFLNLPENGNGNGNGW
jgi:hypothetical protein